MRLGDRVVSKVDVPFYKVKEGDRGVIRDLHLGLGTGNYIEIKWDKGHTDMGWWVTSKPPIAGEALNIVDNLEIEIDLPDTREYLDSIAGLAAQL